MLDKMKPMYKKTKTTITAFVDELLIRVFPSVIQKRFIKSWSSTFVDNADLYNGLYAGLVRVELGKAKSPHKTLKEWYDRTRSNWEDGEITRLSEKILKPVIERADPDECAIWARLLLKASEAAGLRRDERKSLVLTERNANSYTEWNGEELYVGDTVEIMFSAWYQNETLIEQDICTLLTRGEK